ncbi:hypothetical protein M3M50_10575 [Pseudomonas bijieensis]|uniref:hypothetical protein n=1 Tax=Pseudomonas bijieensis TaxID=2681983 RepID=UPI00200C0337|nr:hypothetical protein [Pseudomonas bijieensis]UQI33044.1 hypothetical protein M3M50_10575 [Pseudomonas bijieensis]
MSKQIKRYRATIGSTGSCRREWVYLCSDVPENFEQLFKAVAAQAVSKLVAEPVPPAGGEPLPSRPYASEEDQSTLTDYEIGLGHGGCEMWDKFEPHVTRLQAEVERLKADFQTYWDTDGTAYADLHSELTKARELVAELRASYGNGGPMGTKIDAFLSNQSAPADKGQGEPVVWSYCPECGCEELHHEEGEHKQCANCHQEWFSDIDYSKVVRGNLAKRKAEQPAPVAVVMPERMPGDDGVCTESHYASGWNACLDEVTRLNQIKQ